MEEERARQEAAARKAAEEAAQTGGAAPTAGSMVAAPAPAGVAESKAAPQQSDDLLQKVSLMRSHVRDLTVAQTLLFFISCYLC